MKKFVTLSLAVALGMSVNAEQIKTLTLGMGIPGIDEPQLIGLGISPNGKYVCGTIEYGEGYFVGNVDTNEIQFDVTEDPEGAELRHVDNNGLAIGYNGPGVTYAFGGGETELETPEGYKYVLGEALTADGSVFVGSLVMKGSGATFGAYSKDGKEWIKLPLPADEDLGYYAGEGSMAKYISGDGKVIAGCVGNFGPAIVWVLNENGEYVADPICSKYVVMSEEEAESGEKPFLGLTSYGLSNNGKYVICRAMVEVEGEYSLVPAVYDTEAQSFKVYDEPQEIDENNVGLTPTAICDDGTFIGIVGTTPMYMSFGSFIMNAGETQAEKYVNAFPKYEEMFEFADMVGYGVPTGMSADGRYLLGYAYYSEDFFDDYAPVYFVTYIIDRNDEGNSVSEMPVIPAAEMIFSIDGQRLNEMKKGLNIVRMPDGSVRKVIK